jgi:AbrB family looped-hinge helix DNA binding protein
MIEQGYRDGGWKPAKKLIGFRLLVRFRVVGLTLGKRFNMHTVTTLAKGQIVIPVELRKQLSIEPGSVLEIRLAGDHPELYPLPPDPIAAFRGSLKKDTSLASELIEAHRDEVQRDADS